MGAYAQQDLSYVATGAFQPFPLANNKEDGRFCLPQQHHPEISLVHFAWMLGL